jgi:UBX domain-containing protein 1/4
LAEKRALREVQEKEDKKSNEKIRRKTGQEIILAKEKLEDEQMKKAFAAKKKEKEEEKAAKAKIKAQIEADKRERAAKVCIAMWIRTDEGIRHDLPYL